MFNGDSFSGISLELSFKPYTAALDAYINFDLFDLASENISFEYS